MERACSGAGVQWELPSVGTHAEADHFCRVGLMLWSRVGTVPGELQPEGNPLRISLGSMVSHGRDPTWSKGREGPW